MAKHYLNYIWFYTEEHPDIDSQNELWETHCRVVRMINYFLNKLRIDGIYRLNIHLTSDIESKIFRCRTGTILSENLYFPNDCIEEKVILLKYLNFLKEIAAKYNSEFDVESYFDKISATNFELKDVKIKKKANGTKKRFYRIFFNCDRNGNMEFYLKISDLKKPIKFVESKVISTIKNTVLCFAHKSCWSDDSTIFIYKVNDRDYWEFNLNGNCIFHFVRAEEGQAHGQYDLGNMYLKGGGVLQDKEKAIYWYRKAAEQGYSRAIKALEKLDEK